MMNVKTFSTNLCPPFLRPLLQRINESPIGLRLASGVFWSMAGAVISRGLMLAATVLVARMLGKEGYGELGMIQSTVGMFGIFAGFGLGLTATKHVAEFCQSDPARAGRIIGLSVMIAILTGGMMSFGLFLFAPWLAEQINAPHLAGLLRIGAVILFISALNGAQTGALSGFEAFKTIAHVNLFVGITSLPILVCGAYFGGLRGAVWALAINLCLNWLFNHLALRVEARRHNIPLTLADSTREWSVIWSFSLPAVLSGILVGPVMWAVNAMLANQAGYEQVGILTAVMSSQIILGFIGSMVNAPLFAVIASKSTDDNLFDDRQLTKTNLFSTWILISLFAVPLLCFPSVMEFLYGQHYAGLQFRLSLAFVVLNTCTIMYKQGITRLLMAHGHIWWTFLSNLLWAAVVLGFATQWSHIGAWGVAASFCAGYVINMIFYIPLSIYFGLVRKDEMISWPVLVIWSCLIGSAFLPYAIPMLPFRIPVFVLLVVVLGIGIWAILRDKTPRLEVEL